VSASCCACNNEMSTTILRSQKCFSSTLKHCCERRIVVLISLGLWTLSIVWRSEYKKIQRFGNWDCFRPQPPRIALAEGPNRETGNRSSFRNVVFSCIQNSGRWTQSRDPATLSAIHHRRNPSDSAWPGSLSRECIP
jgi:hypothetical protein